MKARILFSTMAALLIVASQASASVISASSQTARSKPADKIDYLSVTSIQHDLNASMRELADASAPAALGSRSLPSTTSGGFLLTNEPAPNSSWFSGGGNGTNYLFNGGHPGDVDAMSLDAADPGSVIASGTHGPGWNNGRGNRRGGNHGGPGGGHRHGGGPGGGVQPAPEPSTWLLLGAGLTMVGVVEFIRRRA